MPSLKERLQADQWAAMRSGDTHRLDAIRLARAALENAEIAWQREATEVEVQTIIKREIGRHVEALEYFRRAGRQDLIVQEEESIRALEAYLPAQLGPEEVRAALRRIIAEVGATDMKGLGPVMRRAMAEFQGRADGALVNQIARELLNG